MLKIIHLASGARIQTINLAIKITTRPKVNVWFPHFTLLLQFFLNSLLTIRMLKMNFYVEHSLPPFLSFFLSLSLFLSLTHKRPCTLSQFKTKHKKSKLSQFLFFSSIKHGTGKNSLMHFLMEWWLILHFYIRGKNHMERLESFSRGNLYLTFLLSLKNAIKCTNMYQGPSRLSSILNQSSMVRVQITWTKNNGWWCNPLFRE